jgi:B3/4 domain protein
MIFKVQDSFFQNIPNAVFGIIVVKNFDNTKNYDFINKLFTQNLESSKEKFKDVKIKEEPCILPYRDAFTKLGINPNKYMCSIEALMTRISKGKDIPSINPIVDLGNALSLKYELPLGVHDIDNFIDGNIEIREATKDDIFIPFGSTEIEHPEEGEIIYASNTEVKTRRWTWRQGENSKITEKSTNLFIPIDGFTENLDKIKELQNELIDILKNQLNLEVAFGIVDKNNPEFITK